MDKSTLHHEADDCRRRALCFLGRPEARFLLRIAREFDRLSEEGSGASRRRRNLSGEKRRSG